jgi:hypothetical protein
LANWITALSPANGPSQSPNLEPALIGAAPANLNHFNGQFPAESNT